MKGNSELPLGWKRIKLGSICEFNYGKSLPKNNREHSGSFDVYGSNGVVGKHSKYLIDSPCIIVGRKGAAGEVQMSMSPCWPIDTTYYILENPNYTLKFLYYLLKSLQLSALDKSTAIPGLNRNDAYDKIIYLPPLAEQSRIVAKIEELFSNLDRGIERLKAAQQQLKIYRQSVLKWAFEGRIKSSNIENGEIPKEWEWRRTSELFHSVTSGSRGWAKYYSNSGAIFIRMGNLDHDTIQLDLSSIQYVKLPDVTEGMRTLVLKDDILISITADVGMIAIIPDGFPEAYINQHIALVRPITELVIPKYLAWFLASAENGQKQFHNFKRGATKVGLSLDDIKALKIPIPSLVEQQEIVLEIEQCLSVCDKLKESIEQGLKQAEALRQSILKKAFEGKFIS